MSTRTVHSFSLEDGTPLQFGDVFRLKLADVENGRWGYFTFHGHVTNNDSGSESITTYGGDQDPNGRRQFHAFTPQRVQAEAKFWLTADQARAERERRRAR